MHPKTVIINKKS